MQGTIAVVLVLGLLIFFHELGHFLAARMLGIGVKAFSLGFGPKLFSFTRGLTRYQLSLIPLGGYVQLAGERTDDDLPPEFPARTSFALRPAWQRTIVVLAGPAFNFILAWAIYMMLFISPGQVLLKATVGDVLPDSPAQIAGVQAGDAVTAVDGSPVEYWDEMVDAISQSPGGPMVFTISREGSLMDLTITPKVSVRKNLFGEEESTPMIGVVAGRDVVYIKHGPWDASGEALNRTMEIVGFMGQAIVKIVSRVVPLDTVGGPIMIAQLVSQQAKEGLVAVLELTALISINLGLINLLPIPVLDGGHILFFGLEIVFRKPVPEYWQGLTTRIGIFLLVALMCLAIYNDLARIFWS